MNRFFKGTLCVFCIICLLFSSGCMKENVMESKLPEMPEKLSKTDDGTPVLSVYIASDGKNKEMDIEGYLMGVVAGEMKNTWPMEALKAQAILARTFTMRFVTSKDSVYNGADISTDVNEAQAYNAENINDRIRSAVQDTRGMVMIADGEYPNAWFHAHSGGTTELPSKSLDYKEDPPYLKVTQSKEADEAPDDVESWTAEFELKDVERACKNCGVDVSNIESFKIGERGESGRAVTILVNGKKISAPSFRIHIGASKMKSTLIDSAEIIDDTLVLKGKGYGHGVGMSQWGAYQLAKEGKTAEQIIRHYYSDIELIELW